MTVQAHHTVPLRICSCCQMALPMDAEHFNRSSRKWDRGFKYACRSCTAVRRRMLASEAKSPEWVGPSLEDVRKAERADRRAYRRSVLALKKNTAAVRPVFAHG